jgi:ribosomal protein L28
MSDTFSDHSRTHRRFGCMRSKRAASTEAKDSSGVATSAAALKSIDGPGAQAVTSFREFEVGHLVSRRLAPKGFCPRDTGIQFSGLEVLCHETVSAARRCRELR